MPVIVPSCQGFGRVILLPESETLQVPLYDENDQRLFIPDRDLIDLETAQIRSQNMVSKWSENREKIVKQLLEMATTLDGLQYKCNISTTVGSSVGICSGAAVIGGMLLMPPVAIGGLAVGAAAAVSNLCTSLFKFHQTKKRAYEAKVLLEEDSDLKESVINAIYDLEVALQNVIDNSSKINGLNGSSTEKNVSNTVGIVGIAPNIVSIGARVVLRESAAISSNVLKGVVHAAAVVGIALDVISVILAAKSMATGSRCEFAAKLRELAEMIEMERMELQREFINKVTLS